MPVMKYSAIIPILLIIACSSPGNKQVNQFASIDSLFLATIPANEPGGAVLIMKDQKILFSKGYGLADITTREPITTETLFNLGSISKTFVANAILILQDEGKLSVEDPMSKYFSDFKVPEIAEKVKIKNLLTIVLKIHANGHVVTTIDLLSCWGKDSRVEARVAVLKGQSF